MKWPTGMLVDKNGEISYDVDESTTVENLLKEKVYCEKMFKQLTEATFYWLYNSSYE